MSETEGEGEGESERVLNPTTVKYSGNRIGVYMLCQHVKSSFLYDDRCFLMQRTMTVCLIHDPGDNYIYALS